MNPGESGAGYPNDMLSPIESEGAGDTALSGAPLPRAPIPPQSVELPNRTHSTYRSL
jgi:hypothetical protein